MATAAPDTTAPRLTGPRLVGRALVAPVAPRTLVALVHLVLDAVTAVAIGVPLLFIMVVTVATIPVLPVSILSFGLLLLVSRVAAVSERARLAAVPGVLVTDPHRPLSGSWHQRVLTRSFSAATWKEIAYHVLHLPKSLVFASITVTAWAVALALVALPAYVSAVPGGQARLPWWTVEPGSGAAAAAAIGVVLLLVVPWMTRGLSRLSIGMATGLLGGSTEEALRERVGDLEASRAGVIDAAEAERRRIERDLHDGAQQRLVALAMALGLAREKIADDPAAARALVDEAHREAKAALVELRDLARGLHPPVLTDRGLAAAVAGLASRAPVPVEVDVRLERRSPPSIEGIAYFVISESLTNVARHSGAGRARVLVADTGPSLVVQVDDDGVGGARAEAGSGLRGLADRVAAVDGTFAVTSPSGGPTAVRAELPLPTVAGAAVGPAAPAVTAAAGPGQAPPAAEPFPTSPTEPPAEAGTGPGAPEGAASGEEHL